MIIHGLVWDDEEDSTGNVCHLVPHPVTPGEVREVLEGAPLFERVPADGANPVFVAVGHTLSGRLLEVWGIYFEQPPKKGWGGLSLRWTLVPHSENAGQEQREDCDENTGLAATHRVGAHGHRRRPC